MSVIKELLPSERRKVERTGVRIEGNVMSKKSGGRNGPPKPKKVTDVVRSRFEQIEQQLKSGVSISALWRSLHHEGLPVGAGKSTLDMAIRKVRGERATQSHTDNANPTQPLVFPSVEAEIVEIVNEHDGEAEMPDINANADGGSSPFARSVDAKPTETNVGSTSLSPGQTDRHDGELHDVPVIADDNPPARIGVSRSPSIDPKIDFTDNRFRSEW